MRNDIERKILNIYFSLYRHTYRNYICIFAHPLTYVGVSVCIEAISFCGRVREKKSLIYNFSVVLYLMNTDLWITYILLSWLFGFFFLFFCRLNLTIDICCCGSCVCVSECLCIVVLL